jgi:hypothetical protein
LLLQEHLDREPSLLERRFTHREVCSTRSSSVPGLPPVHRGSRPRRKVRGNHV